MIKKSILSSVAVVDRRGITQVDGLKGKVVNTKKKGITIAIVDATPAQGRAGIKLCLTLREEVISTDIVKYLKKLKPDIVVITGHDFFYKNRKDIRNIDNYKNSKYFAEAIKQAREYEKSHDKLFIIAGACQSDYEDLIKAGANFASSPKRVNIHALDPAVIATSIALSSRDKPMDIIKIISRTKYKEEGIGGIITNGTMYTGYPR